VFMDADGFGHDFSLLKVRTFVSLGECVLNISSPNIEEEG